MEYSSSSLKEWHPTQQSLEDRHMIHVYGESNTGKSFIVRHILSVLQASIPQIVVFSPTNEQNHSYDADGEVPSVFIHSQVSADVLNQIWERQQVMRVAFDRANKPHVIKRMARATGNVAYLAAVSRLEQEIANAPVDVRKKLETALLRIAKGVISANKRMFDARRDSLTEEERYTLRYVNFNPRILLVFDDCTEQLRREKGDILEKIFYAGRHMFITTIMACHTDKTFTPELKKQTFLSIYTGSSVASAYIERPSTGFDKREKAIAHAARCAAFTSDAPLQKLVIDRVSHCYYKYTAQPCIVCFGSPEIRALAEKIKRPENETLRGNAYSAKFVLE